MHLAIRGNWLLFGCKSLFYNDTPLPQALTRPDAARLSRHTHEKNTSPDFTLIKESAFSSSFYLRTLQFPVPFKSPVFSPNGFSLVLRPPFEYPLFTSFHSVQSAASIADVLCLLSKKIIILSFIPKGLAALSPAFMLS